MLKVKKKFLLLILLLASKGTFAQSNSVYFTFESQIKPEFVIWQTQREHFISKVVDTEIQARFYGITQKPNLYSSYMVLGFIGSELRPIEIINTRQVSSEKIDSINTALEKKIKVLSSKRDHLATLKDEFKKLRQIMSSKIPIEEISALRLEKNQLTDEKNQLEGERASLLQSLKQLDEVKLDRQEYVLQETRLTQIIQEIRNNASQIKR